jgi:hypothetical protein
MKPWNPEQFKSLIKTFPEGQLLIEYEGVVVASSASHNINFNEYSETSSWSELTASGYITNHNPNGDTLYGIEIMVDPSYRNMKLSRRLYAARQKLV